MGHQATRPLTCPIPPILFSSLRCNYPGTRYGWKCRMMDLEAPHLVVDAYQKPSAPVEQSRSISGEIWGHGCPPSLPLFRPQRFPAKPFRPIRPNSLHHYHGPTVWIFSASWIALDECRGYECDEMISRYMVESYLIFVIFFTLAKFLENKIYTEKRQFFALNL